MKNFSVLRSAQLVLGSALLVLGTSSFAATWNFGSSGGCTQNSSNANNYGNSWNCNGTGTGSTSVTATAWSTTGSGSTYAAANLPQYGGSGFGVQNTGETLNAGSPNHSLDSAPGVTDLISLRFGANVRLDSLNIGWTQTDSDVSVLAYTGPGAPPANIAGRSVSNLLTSGWTLVGSYANLVVGTARTITNAANISSSWWLVSAYNSGFGSSANSSSASLLSNCDDYVKLLAVAGSTVCTPGTPGCGGGQQVAEPATLALFGLAALGVVAVRRRNAS